MENCLKSSKQPAKKLSKIRVYKAFTSAHVSYIGDSKSLSCLTNDNIFAVNNDRKKKQIT